MSGRTRTGAQLVLRLGDAVAIYVAFVAVLTAARHGRLDAMEVTLASFAAAAIGVWAVRVLALWNPRVTAMRWVELSKITRAVGIICLGMLLVDRVADLRLPIEQCAAACVSSWVLLVGWRSVHRSWVAHQCRTGRSTRRVIVVGTGRPAVELVKLFEIHPEAGMRVAGLIGSSREAEAAGLGHLWLAAYADAEEVLTATPTDGVVVCSTDLSPNVLRTLMHAERRDGRELYIHAGLQGVDARRVKASPVANEALLYVEPRTLTTTHLVLKRIFDIVVSAALLVITSPLFVLVAILIKRTDGGPVLFRQQRVGHEDRHFEMIKFRTMVVDAEARLAGLTPDNQRTGPLFKLDRDPRVTTIGNLLRTTSLDELPQLINVLKGEMSLVGPRPALRREVDAFPVELHRRHHVRPGITGLWQVEARDNPAFDAYQRLDLFYVENWSLALDLVILLGTAEQLVLRPFRRRGRDAIAAPEAVVPMATAA